MDFETRYVNIVGRPQLLGLKIRGLATTERRPTHFILLVDTSGSMEMEGRLEAVKRCAKYLLNFLQSSDRISIVRFDENASITVNCQSTSSENRQVIEGHINSLHTGGSTNLSAGLLKVRDVLNTSPQDMKTGLVILTDGFANLGIQDEPGLRSLVSMIRQGAQNLSVSCVGYGYDHAGDLLRNLALEGGGSYNIVSSQEHVGPVFGEILGGLISCVAQNVEIVYPRDYENYTSYVSRDDGNFKRLFIGDIYSESETIVLLKRVGSDNNVTLKGFNCLQMADITTPLQWFIGSLDGQAPYRMFYIRWALAQLLEKARGVGHNRENLLSDIDELERLVEGEGDMVALMRGEFVAAREMLNNRNVLNETAYLQRSMYLASGRGAATQTVATPVRGVSPQRLRRSGAVAAATTQLQDPIPPPGASPSPYMNTAQRAISAAMSQMPNSHA
jgi:hypothetical protein